MSIHPGFSGKKVALAQVIAPIAQLAVCVLSVPHFVNGDFLARVID
jgi:hypothetical protein